MYWVARWLKLKIKRLLLAQRRRWDGRSIVPNRSEAGETVGSETSSRKTPPLARRGELLRTIALHCKTPPHARLEVALFACFGVSIDVFPGISYSYSALALLVLVLEDSASSTSTSTISLSTSTIKAKNSATSKLARRWELLRAIALHCKAESLGSNPC